MDRQATQYSDLNAPDRRTGNSSAEFSEALAKGYEPHDIGLRPVFMFVAGLSLTLVVVLFAIYGIMMGVAAYYRHDSIQSPIAVKLPPVYAPLQPSLGSYDNHDNDHDVLDWQDMEAMRYKTDLALNNSGMTSSGRPYISINSAMSQVIDNKLLVIRPVAMAPVVVSTFPPAPLGSYEGFVNDPLSRPAPIDPALNPNDLQRLNNLGN